MRFYKKQAPISPMSARRGSQSHKPSPRQAFSPHKFAGALSARMKIPTPPLVFFFQCCARFWLRTGYVCVSAAAMCRFQYCDRSTSHQMLSQSLLSSCVRTGPCGRQRLPRFFVERWKRRPVYEQRAVSCGAFKTSCNEKLLSEQWMTARAEPLLTRHSTSSLLVMDAASPHEKRRCQDDLDVSEQENQSLRNHRLVSLALRISRFVVVFLRPVQHRLTDAANTEDSPFDFTEENYKIVHTILAKYPQNYKQVCFCLQHLPRNYRPLVDASTFYCPRTPPHAISPL